jgi:hypothetical protein
MVEQVSKHYFVQWSLVLPLIMFFLFGIAACDDLAEQLDQISTASPLSMITESKISYTREGNEVTRYVRISELAPPVNALMSTNSDQVQGSQFQLELWSDNNELLHELLLNAAFEAKHISFSDESDFVLAFEDYNGDGYPDFSIGQPHLPNYYTYNLYTIKNDKLMLIHQGLVTNKTRYSIAFEKAGNTSFWDRYREKEYGYEVNNLYTWQEGRFLRTSCEGCMMSTEGNWDGTIGVLMVREEKTAEGFTLMTGEENNAYIKSTHLSPPGESTSYAIHTIRRSISTELSTTFKYDIVVVNPNFGDVRSFQLTPEVSGDLYQADSIVGVYGFLDEEHLVYVGIVENTSRASGYAFQVSQMNIHTGDSTVIVEELPDSPPMDFFAQGWLNHDRDTLVLNSYSGGQLWTIDLNQGSMLETQGFKHAWPFNLTVPSPNGERFWYTNFDTSEYQLYDSLGKQVATFPFIDGFEKFPFFTWSPGSKFAVHQSTLEQDDRHVINGDGEYFLIAPERLQFYDSLGKLIRTWTVQKGSDTYIEVAGWLDRISTDTVLLHQFQLSEKEDEYGSKQKFNSRYLLLDIQTGKEQPLEQVESLTQLYGAILADSIEAYQPLSWIDIQNGKITVSANNGSWIETHDPALQASFTTDYETDIHQIIRRDSATDQTIIKDISNIRTPLYWINPNWLVGSDMRYIRIMD